MEVSAEKDVKSFFFYATDEFGDVWAGSFGLENKYGMNVTTFKKDGMTFCNYTGALYQDLDKALDPTKWNLTNTQSAYLVDGCELLNYTMANDTATKPLSGKGRITSEEMIVLFNYGKMPLTIQTQSKFYFEAFSEYGPRPLLPGLPSSKIFTALKFLKPV